MFLMLIGVALAIAWSFPRRYLLIQNLGFAMAGTAAWFAMQIPPRLGTPSFTDVAVLVLSVVAEVVLIVWMYRRVSDERRADAWVLFIVGAHFIPMSLALGPIAAALGVVCMAIAALALWAFPQRSITPFALGDAAAKVAFGALMFFAYPAW
jgi:hypothetical protein